MLSDWRALRRLKSVNSDAHFHFSVTLRRKTHGYEVAFLFAV